MLAALQVAKENLKPVEHTIVTNAAGQRFVERADGSRTSIGTDHSDQEGNWGIMHETSALGIQGASDGQTSKSQPADTNPLREHAMTLIAQHESLAEAWKWYKIGLPIDAIRKKILALYESTPTAAVDQFMDTIAQLKGASLDEIAPPLETEQSFDANEMHGILGDESWDAPRLSAACGALARPGYNSARGHEYVDTPEVLREKVKLLARMVRTANRTVVYAGAGLSTGSGISDYATVTGSSGTLAKKSTRKPAPISPYCALPSLGHRVLAGLGKNGFIWRFIQQNHDGLPQKAGMPQHMLNEIHGAWFDPSNPVVSMSGNLRGDLFDDLLECERSADLAIAVGTSLCGMNADRIVTATNQRARQSESFRQQTFVPNAGDTIGSVIISLQKTVHDANSSLRIFALIDDVMALLAEELALDVPPPGLIPMEIPESARPLGPDVDVFLVPYKEDGCRVRSAATSAESSEMLNGQEASQLSGCMVLDLRDGAVSTITVGPQKGATASVVNKNKDGMWRISVERSITKPDGTVWSTKITEPRLLGYWWVQGAVDGTVDMLPLAPKPLSSL